MNRSSLASFLLIGLLAFVGWSCHQNEQSPGVEYMPDMYRSPAIEAYMDYQHPDSLLARRPVEGTIPFGAEYVGDPFNPNFPYPYPNNTEGYEKAGKELENPLELTPERLKKGERIYTNFCEHCHGSEGKGDGPVIENGGHPPPPSFTQQLSELPEGKAFHTLKYGKGLMGSHASQLSKKERWLVVHYVQVLQNGGKSPFKTDTAKADTASMDTAAVDTGASIETDTSGTRTGNEG